MVFYDNGSNFEIYNVFLSVVFEFFYFFNISICIILICERGQPLFYLFGFFFVLTLSICHHPILHLSLYISTYIAPLQGNYSKALPAQARPKRRGLKPVAFYMLC